MRLQTLAERLWSVRLIVIGTILGGFLVGLIPLEQTYQWHLRQHQNEIERIEVETVNTAVTTLTAGLDHIGRDVLNLATMLDPDNGFGQNLLLEQKKHLLLRFAANTHSYQQIRLLGVDGRETIRINAAGNGFVVVPTEQLQDKSGRPYFLAAKSLLADEYFLSPIDLNREHGVIEEPFQPTLRAAAPVRDKNGVLGVVVLNLAATATLSNMTRSSAAHTPMLVDGNGYWLAGRPVDQLFGFERDHPEMTLAHDNPALWAMIKEQVHGQANVDGDLWTWQHLQWEHALGAISPHQGNFPDLTILTRVPATELHAMAQHERAIYMPAVLGDGVLSLFVGLAIGLLVESRRRQILQLRKTELDLRQHVAELLETRDELVQSEKLASLGLLVSGVAHEINTPIGSALVTVSAVQDEIERFDAKFQGGMKRTDVARVISRSREGLAMARLSLARVGELVKRFKQVASDRASAIRRKFEVGELVAEVLVLLKPRLKGGHVRIETDIPEGMMLDSFPGPIGQVLENLMANALMHAFPDGQSGCVKLAASIDEANGMARFVISDDGVGIPETEQGKIFTPFFTTRRHSGGTGLGLYIVFQIVHDTLLGNISLESAPGHGSRFSVEIPLAIAGNSAASAPEGVAVNQG